MKKKKSNGLPKIYTGQLITINPQKRFQLRVIATRRGRDVSEQHLCCAPDGSGRLFLKDSYGVERVCAAFALRWFADGLCLRPDHAEVCWDPSGLRDFLFDVAQMATAGIAADAVQEAKCLKAGTILPTERWTKPPPNTVPRQLNLFAPLVERMERECAKHKIPVADFIEAAVDTQCNGMDEAETVQFVSQEWPAQKAAEGKARR